METTYKGCDITITLLIPKDGMIDYEYLIFIHKPNQSFNKEFEGTMNYIGDQETINHLLSKAQRWIDDYLAG